MTAKSLPSAPTILQTNEPYGVSQLFFLHPLWAVELRQIRYWVWLKPSAAGILPAVRSAFGGRWRDLAWE